jgi:hypothetical protein
MSIRQFSNQFIKSFPIQLVVMHFKKNQIMMLYWVLLFGFITRTIASKFGIPFLFLDPEYMGNVNKWSFFIIGLSLGAFIMAFNIASFMLNGFRFSFLATLSRTFQKYAFNNFIIPLSFIILHCYQIYSFQYYSQLKDLNEIYIDLLFYFAGMSLVIFATMKYFTYTNKDIYKLFGVEHGDKDHIAPAMNKPVSNRNEWRVATYIIFPLRVKLVRDTRHYKRYMLERVFRQNHVNAAVIELIIFVTFIAIGLFRDHPFFRLPAGGSILLLFTMLIMLSGVFRYWLRAWANTTMVLIFFLLNFLSQFETFNPRNQAYGLDYKTEKVIYSRESLEAQVADSIVKSDISHTTDILNKWKENWRQKGVEKPKMILLNVSGGGLRSGVFTFRTLQIIDSVMKGELMHSTSLITGSSGGMISASYYRELFLRQGEHLNASDEKTKYQLVRNTGKDMLNTLVFSATVADLFMNMQQFQDGKYHYVKDRAYAWEQQLNENTGHVLDKRLADYYQPESDAKIPMMIITPTIINDGRGLQIAAQPVSYLLQASSDTAAVFHPAENGVEFQRFFKNQNSGNLRFTSALRMNATFPYIMPAISLPSEPAIEVMDAGIRDNYGTMNTMQFLFVFRDWISENTSGVILLQIRDTYKKPKIENTSVKTLVEKISAPMRNLSGNFLIMQDYTFDHDLQYAKSWFKGQLDYVTFEMPEMEEKISLSWHLTEKEKNFLSAAPLNTENRKSLNALMTLLYPADGISNPPTSAKQ